MDELDKKRLEARKANLQKIEQLSQIYEDSLEPKIVILYRRIEEMISRSGLPLTQIHLVLGMLVNSCIDQAFEKYVIKGAEKLKGLGLEKRDG